MDKIQFPYRSDGHLVLLHVVHESGSWEKHGLDVNYDFWLNAGDAHSAVEKGEIEFVSGNHVTPYAARLKGDSWIYLGQTVNLYNHRLVVRPDSGVGKVQDLKGKRIGHQGEHPGLNNWLFLKEAGLDVDRGDITMERWKDKTPSWEGVQRGKLDAVLVVPPDDLLAKRAGLKVIEVPFQPMIWFTTISTSSPFAAKNAAIVERFLKGMSEGIHFFKTQKAKTQAILEKRYADEAWDREIVEHVYKELADNLETKLYPSLAAIQNVFELAKRQSAESAKVNPLSLWDTHHLRRLDDSGFFDKLYA